MKYQILILIIIVLSITLKANPCEPEGIHITYGDWYSFNQNPTAQIQVIFSTKNECGNNKLQYYHDSTSSIIEQRKVFKYKETCYYHHFYISNLKNQGQLVKYEVQYPDDSQTPIGSNESKDKEAGEMIKTKQFSFIFNRNNQNLKDMNKIVFFGDFDSQNKKMSQDTVDSLIKLAQNDNSKKEFKAIVHTGDIAYNMPDNEGQTAIDYFKDLQEAYSQIPYVASIGNHELDQDLFKNSLPNVQMNDQLYYSWNIGNMHLIALNLFTKTQLKDGQTLDQYMSEQFTFLKEDLERANSKANREEYPWIIVYTHYPYYCSFDFGDPNPRHDCKIQRSSKYILESEDLLNKYKVDLVIQSHVHQQERTFPVYLEKVAKYKNKKYDCGRTENCTAYTDCEAPIYVTEGVPGNRYFLEEQKYELESFTAYKGTIEENGVIQTGYAIVSSNNDQELIYEHYNSRQGKVTDIFKIQKNLGNNGADDKFPESKGLSTVEIIIITLSCIAVIAIGIATYVYLKKSKKKNHTLFEQDSSQIKTSNINFDLPELQDTETGQ